MHAMIANACYNQPCRWICVGRNCVLTQNLLLKVY